MKSMNIWKGAAVSLACLGMVIPQSAFAVGPTSSAVAAKTAIHDVAMVNGTFHGTVVNGQGEILAGSIVNVSHGSKQVASVVTNQEGQFEVNNLTTGIYQVSSGQVQAPVRLWEAQYAPPTARENVLLVDGQVARGQMGNWLNPFQLSTRTLIITTAVVATAIAVPVAIHNNNDDDPASPN